MRIGIQTIKEGNEGNASAGAGRDDLIAEIKQTVAVIANFEILGILDAIIGPVIRRNTKIMAIVIVDFFQRAMDALTVIIESEGGRKMVGILQTIIFDRVVRRTVIPHEKR